MAALRKARRDAVGTEFKRSRGARLVDRPQGSEVKTRVWKMLYSKSF